jgi:hypothetical protein
MEGTERELTATTLRCAGCGEVIGVYEPLVHVVGGIAHKTSRAADPALVDAVPGSCYHVACWDLDESGLVAVE